MSQHNLLVTTLKQSLKSHGKTYADVAEYLSLSEASVKRLFSDQSFTLQRLEDICHMLKLEISDLVQLMQEQNTIHLSGLTEQQETEIASDIGLLLVTVCILNKWTKENIIEYFNFTEPQCIGYLTKLDKLKLIELLPKNNVKLLVAANFKWRDNGPIQRFFLEKLQAEFFNSQFKDQHEKLLVVNAMLAKPSQILFQRKMDQLAKELNEFSNDDANLPIEQRYGVTMVVAMRPWTYGLFEGIRKK
jgi:DNA-binding Xre family transcriptional regulator